jgi:Flp pilus assembly protein TadD
MLAAQPGLAHAHYLLGLVRARQGDLEGSLEALERALSLEPRDPEIRLALGSALRAAGRHEAAWKTLESLQHRGVDVEQARELARSAWLSGRFEVALHWFEFAARARPEDARNWPAWANALIGLGRRPDALTVVEEGLGSAESGMLRMQRGLCLFEDSAPETSMAEFETAHRLDPGNLLIRSVLGVALDFTGLPREARPHLEHCRREPATAARIEAWDYMKTHPAERYFGLYTQTLDHAVRRAPADGLALEFGVFYGRSIRLIAGARSGAVHGFDTFAGLPEDWSEKEKAGSYSTHGALPEVPENVALHRGLFKETLPGFLGSHGGRVSFAHVDCDLYTSTRSALEPLAGRLRAGSIIVFDEYLGFPAWREHEYRAFQEFIRAAGIAYRYAAYSLFDKQAAIEITAV